MKPIEIKYKVSIGDFRKASYYALALRSGKALKIMAGVLAADAGYYILQLSGVLAENSLPLFIALGYVVWLLLLFANTERSIRRYVTSPASVLGLPFVAGFTADAISFSQPERSIDQTFPLKDCPCVFELGAVFLFYVSQQETYIVPKYAFSDEALSLLRSNLYRQLPDRFSSRFAASE